MAFIARSQSQVWWPNIAADLKSSPIKTSQEFICEALNASSAPGALVAIRAPLQPSAQLPCNS